MSGLERVGYTDRGTALTGWLAKPHRPARGALVLYPTIANVNAPMERRAAMLADAGFVVLIADFYGQPVASFEAAQTLAAELRADVDHYRLRLSAAVSTLRGLDVAAHLAVGAVGYCMGGQAILELARAGEDLILAASFHGILDSGRRAVPDTAIRPRLLICHGDADPLVPRSSVIAFWEEMDRAKANWHFHSYSGVRHGFTDPGSDARGLPAIGYDASADRQSWAALMNLCDELFPPSP